MQAFASTPAISGRTRFGNIVTEFWAPKRVSRKAVILCDGCPSLPQKKKLAEFLTRKGYWVFHPRYRGTWESGGAFLQHSPHEDILLVAIGIRRPFENIYDGTSYILDLDEVVVCGVSFGGTAALLASLSPLVTRSVAIAPVIDWKSIEKGSEPIASVERLLRLGFEGAYRMKKGVMKKLLSGTFYSPQQHRKELDPEKIFIIHAKDDDVVPISPTLQLVKQGKISAYFPKSGGHLSSSFVMERDIWAKIDKFLKHR